METLHQVTGVANAVIDLEGSVITRAGWQKACIDFHRANADSCRRCTESDTLLVEHLAHKEAFAEYRCLNGLVDTAAPIVVDGMHIANVFAGQFLTAPPDLAFFRRQATQFGFDEEKYIEAILQVPVLPREQAEAITRFNAGFAAMLADSGLSRLRDQQAAAELARLNTELEARVQARAEALRRSEATIKNKLKSILEPDGDIGTLELADVIDAEALQSMMDDFYRLTKMGIGIIDLSGNVLVGSGWQDICTKFYRCHPETRKNCQESDQILSYGVKPGTFKSYRCKNALRDMVTPIIVGGKHLGNLFFGQYFYDDEIPDIEVFREQAHRYGFDEEEMLSALNKVQRFSREQATTVMSFYAKLAGMISKLSFSAIQLSKSLSEITLTESALRASEADLKEAQRVAGVGSWRWNLRNRTLIWSEQLYRIFGRPADSPPATYREIRRCFTRESWRLVEGAFRRCRSKGVSFECDAELRRPDGNRCWVSVRGQAEAGPDGDITGVHGTILDITERKQSEDKILFIAFHDALTLLPNRSLAKDRFGQAAAYADRSKSKVALLFVDLDNFKTINDSLGHLVGDVLVQKVAERLNGSVREMDTVCRLGGDEFIVVLPALQGTETIAPVLDKLIRGISETYVIEGHELTTSASIGIAIYPDDGSNFEALLKKADMAMYRAKDSGRNTYRFFDDEMNTEAIEQLRIRSGLRRALAEGEFILHYQPQIDIVSGRLTGMEALIRWKHPRLGIIPPNRFIHIAEDSGLIVPIGEWVLDEACRQAALWQKAEGFNLTVAVNISAVQLKRGDMEQSVERALSKYELPPSLLELELTESVLIQDPDKIMSCIRRLKRLGISLSIDDFGTGYSSLAYLKRFQVDRLKIDQSFVRDLSSEKDDTAIVKAIIHMAKSLGLTTVAEGVENVRALDLLRESGCDKAQGYYYARPMPAEEFMAFAARHKSAAAGCAIVNDSNPQKQKHP